ncbi:recombinase family protein [Corynebacterium glutamicum]|uniref:Site-specific recombinases, DNA invertase Pin homologs n=1 Tax=Corynebacterium glutamicum (strain ATCC 13032 / DSM 20300 / JCM 1318 / BCRC 11384 / CCUG 27702 / LMG 3730 / NBRC 12168 / NCIMB 10025 / NRRL B-2784 / 534) TaxID=196627 RepID=Q8NLI4_CORGL|nr:MULTISPECIES: recombinase family protein [Corynebacterium]ALP51337.1 resolvase [Corynebacterium glutamicum]ANR63836.1 site-specific recombinase [[Brevibacterium] flavum ZL-1]ANR66844.1 site-specific recombinase [Corynebacterium glutamicum ZL-6]ANU34859.1 resolvase [Corynebacterium glutamicum]ASW15250.1 hypothetical protein cgc1_3274 [Corynebacterium glutamicum]
MHFIKENLIFSAESNALRAQLMLSILGSFAEFERSIIRERQAEGIAWRKRPASTRAANAPSPRTTSRKPGNG